jgi:hypothetical protein
MRILAISSNTACSRTCWTGWWAVARLVAEASITVPLLGKAPDPAQMIADPELSRMLRAAIADFVRDIVSAR